MIRPSVLSLLLLGAMLIARAADAPEIEDTDTSPYHVALTAYKSGHYDAARAAIDQAEKAKPGDFPTEILKSRILSEQGDFADGETLLKSLQATVPDADRLELDLAFGDLLLRKRSFDRASKYYAAALQAKPSDPDIALKLIYAKVGSGDLVGAGQDASHLSPLDPKNPYDDHASYYFAKAAIAHATGNSAQEEDNIQTARTIYGITVANHYLKTYLEVFTGPEKNPAADITPAPLIKPAPSGAK
jgi:tetratricopeptide (TPR) repeat protein